MDSFTIGNSLSKLSMLETWHPRTDEDLASISSERLTPGERLLECYTVESDALRGGMGSVWRVRYDALDKPLAMKRPQPRFFAEASVEVKERFIHECEAWIGLLPSVRIMLEAPDMQQCERVMDELINAVKRSGHYLGRIHG